jgi:GTP-binding protein
MFKQSQKRVGTGTLNRVLREAVEAHPPTARDNRLPRIYYATQVGTAPPTVVLFVNHTHLFDATYQRYLLNVFREKLPFHDIPIKLYLRARTQSDPNATYFPTDDPTADVGSRVTRSHVPQPVGEFSHHRHLDREVNELLSEIEE